MPRYRIDLSYNGSSFYGWQIQPKQNSVQAEIESALSKLNSNQAVEVVGCGRTDTGVHAHHYVLHTELMLELSPEDFIYKLNKMLPPSIAFQSIKEVSVDFHARFSAKRRTYRYFIHQKKDPFRFEHSWYMTQALDIDSMNRASNLLIGKQDFTSFSKLHTDVKTNICEVHQAEWHRIDEDTIYFEITADRFLRNMVRAIVGTMVDVGLGKLTAEDIPAILTKKDRGEASVSVPAHGLYLWKVEY
jgi:tRNA pseudouridine38-40 synthase